MASKKISPIIIVAILVLAFVVGTYLPKLLKNNNKVTVEQISTIQANNKVVKKTETEYKPSFKELQIQQTKNTKYSNSFVFGDMDNSKEIPLSDFKGKLVVLSLWMSGCRDCIYELKTIEQVKKTFIDKPVEFIPVTLDFRGATRAYSFLSKNNINLSPLYMDIRGTIRKYRRGGSIPETIFIGPNGDILGIASQPVDWANPKNYKLIENLLAKTGLL